MALLQAILTLIAKSAGKILNAIFGWAVRALFGQTTARDQTILSAVVGGAVAWPILLLGVAFPRIAAFALAFVPLPHAVPAWIIRLVWVGLALCVPLAVGIAMSKKAPPEAAKESKLRRLLRGFPITVGLAVAFLFMFVTVPVVKLVAIVRRRVSADVPLVTMGDGYVRAAQRITWVLNQHGFALAKEPPAWWVTAPAKILGKFGGAAFRAYVPPEMEYYCSPALEVSFYPSGVLLRGARQKVTWAQGLITEAALGCDGTETTSAEALELEKEIRRIWQLVEREPEAHRGSPALVARVHEMTSDLGAMDLDLDDWRVLYRQLLQVSRALAGQRPLFQEVLKEGDVSMADETEDDRTIPAISLPPRREVAVGKPPSPPPSTMSTPALLKEALQDMTDLVKKEVTLAKSELKGDLQAEVAMVKGLAIAALGGLLAVNALVVAAILALASVLPGWAAGLIVAGVLFVAVALIAVTSWGRRVRAPLARVRHSLHEDASRLKEFTA